MCRCMSLLCLQGGMLCYFNVQIFMPEQFILKEKKDQYEIQLIDPGRLTDMLCRIVKVNHDLTTQLSIIFISLLTPNFACNAHEYFKDSRRKSTCQSQNALFGTHSDI